MTGKWNAMWHSSSSPQLEPCGLTGSQLPALHQKPPAQSAVTEQVPGQLALLPLQR